MSALTPDFTHLCVHSHYSLLRATPSPEQLVERAVQDGLRSLALTDTNALYGAMAFSRACRGANIRPITGMTLSLANPLDDVVPDSFDVPGEVVLLAYSPAGYRSLSRLSSALQADPERARRIRHGLSWDTLRGNTEGLFCITGGRTDWLERYLRAGNVAAAQRYLSRLGGLFGEHACVGVSADLPGMQSGLESEMLRLTARFGLRAVAMQPIYCLEPSEAADFRLLAAIENNIRLEAVEPAMLPALGDPRATLHWPGPEVMAERFAARPELLAGVAEVAAACHDALPDGRPIWPSVALGAESAGERLRRDALAGLAQRYDRQTRETAAERLEHELAAIERHGFAPLFLVVADLVAFARRADIPVSTRGSVANSLVAYCVGITTVDPVAHDLLFERFLNPARSSPPDIDLDFCSRRRDEVLDYARQTYGADRMALVGTINTFRRRSALRETAKAYGLAEEQAGRLAALLPGSNHPDPRRRQAPVLEDILAQIDDLREREVLTRAFGLIGRPDHIGLHPGGIVLTPGPLTDYVPLQWAAKGFLSTQFEHGDVEALGLQKIDCLGIRALTVLADAVDIVRATAAPDMRLDRIPMDDTLTGDLLESGETIGVFQCESAGARRTLRKLGARNVADLAVAGAFFKPGPALGGMAGAFIRRYRGLEAVHYLHPSLEPILSRTKGVLLFQEQVLRLGREIAGLSWEQADHLRKGISKFQAAEMEQLAEAFMSGCRRPPPEGHGLSAEQARRLWEQILPFAGYGFNQGHATAYADVSYRSAYLKAHWLAAFLCARLADAGGFHHPAIYIAEARRLGIAVRPPHVNHSLERFHLTFESLRIGESPAPVLWMGLGQVRDLRRTTIERLLTEQAVQRFSDLRDLLARVPMSNKEIGNLIRCGALDGLGESRADLLRRSETIGQSGNAAQLAFGFLMNDAAAQPESAAERFAWERHLIDLPISVDSIAAAGYPAAASLRQLRTQRTPQADLLLYRLPGWTGGPGIFVSDGDDFVNARFGRDPDVRWPAWELRRVTGRWLTDEWGVGWLEVSASEPAGARLPGNK